MTTTLLQVSDPHFGTERPDVVEALVRTSHELAPDVVVLSGDVTQRATPVQFAAARRFVDRLKAPATVVIPGNHDIPLFNVFKRVFAPYAGHKAVFGDDLEPVFESEEVLVVTVNTTRRFRHENGVVSSAQVARVAQRFEHATTDQLRIVVTHQPVAVTKPQDRKNLLIGHEAAVRGWSKAGADLILGGHIHLPFVVPLHRRYDGLAQTTWAVQAGTALSNRLRHGADNSVNVVRYGGLVRGRRCAKVERWDYDARTKRFRCVHAEELNVHPVATA